MTAVPWNDLLPNPKNAWLTEGLQADFDSFIPIGSKETKAQKALEVKAIFKNYGRGVATSRDTWVYNFSREQLAENTSRHIDSYNEAVDRWKRAKVKGMSADDFVVYDTGKMSWSRDLKQDMQRGNHAEYDEAKIRQALYRPFSRQFLFFDRIMNEEVYVMPAIFPREATEAENVSICVTDLGSEKPFMVLATSQITDLHLVGAGASTQCFPLYTYALDGTNRRDNVTDWALAQFRAKYGPDVTKRDIFHYVYGLLHSPQYRERYKENLKRELPRIPLVGHTPPPGAATLPEREGEETGQEGAASSAPTPSPSSSSPLGRTPVTEERGNKEVGSPFHAFVAAGAALAALHVGYEQAAEYPLTVLVNTDVPFSWRVTRMRLNKEKTAVVVNEALTLAGIPPGAFEYKLGNRSALEWVLDQYQVGTDKRSGIVSDPNRADDPEYIVRLVRRVVTVSVETARLVASLPPLAPPS